VRNFYVRGAFRILLRVQPSSSPLHKVFQKGYPIIYKTVTNIKYILQKAFFAAFRQKKTKNRDSSKRKLSTFVSYPEAETDNISFLLFALAIVFASLNYIHLSLLCQGMYRIISSSTK